MSRKAKRLRRLVDHLRHAVETSEEWEDQLHVGIAIQRALREQLESELRAVRSANMFLANKAKAAEDELLCWRSSSVRRDPEGSVAVGIKVSDHIMRARMPDVAKWAVDTVMSDLRSKLERYFLDRKSADM